MDRRLIFSIFVILLSLGHVSAEKPPKDPPTLDCTVFVSSPDGQIQCVKVDGSKTKVTTIFENLDGSFSPEDFTVGPDKHFYVANTPHGEVLRINGDPNSADFLTAQTVYDDDSFVLPDTPPFTEPQGPSFHQTDLYVNSEEGIFRFDNIAGTSFGDPVDPPVEVVSAVRPGEGTDFRLGGELVAVERNASGRVLGYGPPFPAGAVSSRVLITGFDFPIGIAVDAAFPNDHIFVADNGNRNVIRCDGTDIATGPLPLDVSACTVVADFDDPDSTEDTDAPYFIESALNGDVYVVTEDDEGLGIVWLIEDAAGTPNVVEIANMDDFFSPGNKPGSVSSTRTQGVALLPTGTTCASTDNFFRRNQAHTALFECASYGVTISFTADKNCRMTVTADQVFPSDLNAEFAASGFPDTTCTSDDHANGWCTIIDDGDCTGDQKDIVVQYSKWDEKEAGGNEDPDLQVFPAVMEKIDGDWVDVTTAFYSGGPIPGDGTRRSRGDSELALADRVVDNNFVGFFPPFGNCRRSTSEAGPDCVFDIGTTRPVKFQFLDGDGNPVTVGEPRISVQRLFDNALLLPSGGGSNDENIARFDVGGQQWIYNLRLVPEPVQVPGYTTDGDALYRLIVIEENSLGAQPVIFKVQQ